MTASGTEIDVQPARTLWLLSIAHAVNHAQAVLLPLIFLRIIDEFHVTEGSVAILAAAGAFASGAVQLSYASLTRYISRKRLLAGGGILFGGGFAAQALAGSFTGFAIPNVLSRIGGSPQHPVGNGLLAEQFPTERRGFAISAHIAGGNVGTVVVAVLGAPTIALVGWRGASVVFGIPAIVIALGILLLVRETGTDRTAALAYGSVRNAFRVIARDRDILWLYLTSVLGGGGRGLGVVNLFALIYLTKVIGLDDATSGLMYGALIVFSVPVPLVAGWLSDRIGRKPLIVGVYLGGAVASTARFHAPRVSLSRGRRVRRARALCNGVRGNATGQSARRQAPAIPGSRKTHHSHLPERRTGEWMGHLEPNSGGPRHNLHPQ